MSGHSSCAVEKLLHRREAPAPSKSSCTVEKPLHRRKAPAPSKSVEIGCVELKLMSNSAQIPQHGRRRGAGGEHLVRKVRVSVCLVVEDLLTPFAHQQE